MEDIAQIYKALSEQMRLRILMLLIHGELCVCDLMEVLDEPQSKVSRHLAYLKNSGLIRGRRVGTWMHYSLMEPLEGPAAAQIEFLRIEFSGLGWARDDKKKMEEALAKKTCETVSACQRKDGPRARKKAS